MKTKLALLVLFCLSTGNAWACTVCFGNTKSNQTKAVIAGILFLLGLIGSVLAALVVTILRIKKRSQSIAAAQGNYEA